MNTPQDVRWIQRFNNYLSALAELREAVETHQTRSLNKLEKQGVIQSFEYTHELAWKLLKDYLTDRGVFNLIGSKDATREAFKAELITDGEVWMDMILKRNLTSHTYDNRLADEVFDAIINAFYPAFNDLAVLFKKLKDNE